MPGKKVISSNASSSSTRSTPIFTPRSPDSANDDGGALLNDLIEALQRQVISNDEKPKAETKGAKRSKKATTQKAQAHSSKKTASTESAKVSTQPVKQGEKRSTQKTKRTTVTGAFNDYFGDESKLANWQRLCADLDIKPMPASITQCRKALKNVWVNIFDFLDAKAAGVPVRKFASQKQLAQYTVSTGKVFPKKKAKEGGPARLLLAHIFSYGVPK